jgi:hypothetical protein
MAGNASGPRRGRSVTSGKVGGAEVSSINRNHARHVPGLFKGSPGMVLTKITRLRARPEWGRQGSNLRPRDYESPALTTELLPLGWSYAAPSRFIQSPIQS